MTTKNIQLSDLELVKKLTGVPFKNKDARTGPTRKEIINHENVKILIAEDQCVVRKGIIKILSSGLPNVEFGEATDVVVVMRMLLQSTWNLVILDINLRGRSGMEVLKDIKSLFPSLPVVIFSKYPEDQFAIRAIKSGASAYLTQDISDKEMETAIKAILNGEQYFTPTIATLITNELRDSHNKHSHDVLSNREHEVFLLIASGQNVSDIARKLSLSVKTISVYRALILKKMNLKNNAEITHYAFKHNLVE